MSKSKKGSNRREFLGKSAVVLSSLAIPPLLRNDIAEKLANKILPRAFADDRGSSAVNYSVEICIRLGYPLSSLFPTFGQTDPNRDVRANVQCNPNEIRAVTTSSGRQLLLSKHAYDSLQRHGENIAVVWGMDSNGQHTALFQTRSPNRVAAVPSVLFPAASAQTTLLNGVGWMLQSGQVQNTDNGLTPLTMVNNADQFRSLFTKPVLRLSEIEMGEMTRAVASLNDGMAQSLMKRLKNVFTAQESGNKAAQLLTNNYAQLLTLDAAAQSAYSVADGANMGNGLSCEANLGEILGLTALGFQNGLIKSTTVALDTGDWHGRNDPGDNTTQASSAMYIARKLNAFIQQLKNTPDPLSPGKSLFDHTVISISTEFTRGKFGMDGQNNTDGDTNAAVFIGGPVKGGTYGDVRVKTDSNGNDGVDPFTGGTTVGQRLMEASIYRTHCKLLGISDGLVRNQLGAVNGDTLTCLIRS